MDKSQGQYVKWNKSEKNRYHMTSPYVVWIFFKKKESFIIIEKKIVVAPGGRRGREQMGKGNIKKFKNG